MDYTPPTQPIKPLKTKPKFLVWLKKHWISAALIALAVVLAGGFMALALTIKPEKFEVEKVAKVKEKEKFYSLLTGLEVADKSAAEQAVTGVMIENSPDSRPQSGLKDAGIVYEANAEGGITRFMALYQQNKPELIGPVRSLRIYYLDWAAPYQASIAHVGGSSNALDTVRNGYRDIDQFFNAGTYWRASDRYAPHNVYTSGTKIDELNASKGYTSSKFTGFDRTDGKPAAEPNATSINVGFSSPLYATSYAYDSATNTYNRSLAGAAHQDREKGQISPNVVVVIRVGSQLRSGPDGYEDLVTSGNGQAYVFQNGTVTEATWHKADRDTSLSLTDSSGSQIKLNRGQTWVSAITDRGSVSWQ